MKSYLKLSLLLGASLASQAAVAETKPYYIRAGVGYALPNYSGEYMKKGLESFKNDKYEQGIPLAYDLGLYFDLGNNATLLGASLNLVNNPYKLSKTDKNPEIRRSLFQTNLGLSALHFFGTEPGDGLFLRADVGPTRFSHYRVESSEKGSSSTFSGTNYGWGVGGLIGAGYGFTVSSGLSLLLEANYSMRPMSIEETSSTGDVKKVDGTANIASFGVSLLF